MNFDLNGFGTNAGEGILCKTLPGRNVYDVFFPGQSLFLLNADGKPVRKNDLENDGGGLNMLGTYSSSNIYFYTLWSRSDSI
jgi:hypothetical protein